jgi:hypothetical protein
MMYAVDIVDSGSRLDIGQHLSDVLYRLVETASAGAGIAFEACYHEDRGDGLFAIVPLCTTPETVLGLLPAYLHGELRRYNTVASARARLQLRMAVEAGFASYDGRGIGGRAVHHLFRLLDAPLFKEMVAAADAELGLIASNELYENVIRSARGIVDPGTFEETKVTNKELTGVAWVTLPGTRPAPAGSAGPATTVVVEPHAPRRRLRRHPPLRRPALASGDQSGFDPGPCLS